MTATHPVTLVCWNIEHKHEPWRILRKMKADVSLLQETRPPPPDAGIPRHHISDGDQWPEGGRLHGRAAIVRLSDRVDVTFIEKAFSTDPDVLAAARIQPPHGEPFIAVSIAPAFEYPHDLVPGKMGNVDSSLHRSISDSGSLHWATEASSGHRSRRPHCNARSELTTTTSTGAHVRKPSSTGWTPLAYSASDRRRLTADRQIPGRNGCRGKARTCRPSAGSGPRRRMPRPNSTMSSRQRAWSTPCTCAPSTSRTNGGRATTAGSLSKSDEATRKWNQGSSHQLCCDYHDPCMEHVFPVGLVIVDH